MALKDYFNMKAVRRGYSQIRSLARTGFNTIRKPVRMVAQGANWLDEQLKHASNIPLIQDGVNMIRDNPVYAQLLGAITSADHKLDTVGNIGSTLDSMIEKGLSLEFSPASHLSQLQFSPRVSGGVPQATPIVKYQAPITATA